MFAPRLAGSEIDIGLLVTTINAVDEKELPSNEELFAYIYMYILCTSRALWATTGEYLSLIGEFFYDDGKYVPQLSQESNEGPPHDVPCVPYDKHLKRALI